jgi:exopolyphosphatase/guanosine-5'-triphosphate,3'-diphosphate pyrophosphatase
MLKAVIDIGSNSIKLAIGEPAKGSVKLVEFLKNIIPIGSSSFYKNAISQEAINQTIKILKNYKKTLAEYQVEHVKVIATTAIREANNRDIFIDLIKRKTGFEVEVLEIGDVIFYIESYISFKVKDIFPLYQENILIAELGTGSLDVSLNEKGLSCFNIGLPIGTLRLKHLIDNLGSSFDENLIAVEEFIENEFQAIKKNLLGMKIDDIILIDENYSPYFDNVIKSARTEHNFQRITAKETANLIRKLKGRTVEEVHESYNIPLEVADTILAYAVILNNFCKLISKRHIHVFDISLSKAVLTNMLYDVIIPAEYNWHNQLMHEAQYLCKKFMTDLAHSNHVAATAATLFKALQTFFGFEERHKTYLMLAAYLHDIGMFIHNRAHHKHTEYIAAFLNLIRLNFHEKKIIACVARYHRKNTPSTNHAIFSSLPNAGQVLVKKLSAILRIANALDTSHRQKIKKLELKINEEHNFILTVHTNDSILLEKADFSEKKNYLEELTGMPIQLIVKAYEG